jgi:peptide/nickel transport system ATP-binding protein
MSQVQLDRNASTPPADDSSILQVSGLNVHFKRSSIVGKRGTEIVKAVNDVSFELKKSDITSIVGESGSGKTTVARCILKLLEPDSGSIKFEGRDIKGLKGEELQKYRRDVQIIYQDPFESLNPRHNVLTTVGLPIRFLTGTHNDSEIFEQVTKLLGEVGLDPANTIHRFPHQLSGGQRQRVSIARALACGPKLLIADEPITMLDAAQRMNILSLIHDLIARRNLTVLIITHDLASARLISQKTIVMYVGRIVEYANTESILNEPRHPYVELLLKASPGLNMAMPSYDEYTSGTIEDSAALTKGCVFRPRCKYAQAKCADVSPPLEQKAPDHFAACHYPLASGKSQEGIS